MMRIDHNTPTFPAPVSAWSAPGCPYATSYLPSDLCASLSCEGHVGIGIDWSMVDEASILKTAEGIQQMIQAQIQPMIEFMQDKVHATKLEALASILSGNLPYVGEPYGTHMWDPVQEVFVFVGSGGTHGINLLMLLLGPTEEEYEEHKANPNHEYRKPSLPAGSGAKQNDAVGLTINIDIGNGAITQ